MSKTITLAEGQKALEMLIEKVDAEKLSLNEAETRFHIIDKILKDCLGWPEDLFNFKVEVAEGRQYSDYELGMPRRMIWEAKKAGQVFELPVTTKDKIFCDLPSIMMLDKEAKAALLQVQGYCSARGVEIAVATNGHQLIAFLASRSDGVSPLDGKCLRINSLSHLLENFPRVWQMLSPEGVLKQNLHRFLRLGDDKSIPEKMSKKLPAYPKYRYPNDLQSSLRSLSELLLVDATEQSDVEKNFYEECYCESGALSQHALVSKQMLAARYDALFDEAETSPKVSSIVDRKSGKHEISKELKAEAALLRPIVLLGDVGVGKTSFLKNLMYVRASEEFNEAIFIYIDLGSKGALATDLESFVIDEIEDSLYSKYSIDVYEEAFVKGVYSSDIQRFSRGIYGSLKDSDPAKYDAQRREMLDAKIKNKDSHLRAAIAHVSSVQKKQVIVAIDNADQREYEVQQKAFIISQNLAKDWKLMVFISVRPQTFYYSKFSGALTAYPNRVFTISPPRVDAVLEKRLRFALNMAEGRVPVEILKGIRVNLQNIATFIKALLHSIQNNVSIVEFLSNITGGNIREAIDLVTKLIGSPNVDAEKIIKIMEENGSYLMPLHEFWKAALLGDYYFFDPVSSMATNLFDVSSANPNEHFLLPMMLGFISSDGQHRSKEFFVETNTLVTEMQNWGFSIEPIHNAIRRAVNKKLLETSQRVTFEEDSSGLYGDMPSHLRVTTVGVYHLRKWAGEFAYLDAVSYDTPVFDRDAAQEIMQKLGSIFIGDRYNKANAFREYLTAVWGQSSLNPSYFSWQEVIEGGANSFLRVLMASEKLEADT